MSDAVRHDPHTGEPVDVAVGRDPHGTVFAPSMQTFTKLASRVKALERRIEVLAAGKKKGRHESQPGG